MTDELIKQSKNIQFLEFELSNQCHYTKVHEWCPRNRLGDTPVITLETSAIKKVIQYFKKFDYSGSVYFSIYNEPLIDNRIFYLIDYVKKELPKCTVQMYTNGILLDFDTAEYLFNAGLDILRLSGYSNEEIKKLTQLQIELKNYGIQNYIEVCNRIPADLYGHDNRIDNYTTIKNFKEPCYMPIQYFMVYCDGGVSPCFDDWKQSINFGNVYTDDISEILINTIRLRLLENLKSGNRSAEKVCSCCDRPTWMCLTEYKDRIVL